MYEDEKIVDSQWKIMIKGDKAVFNAKQVELNIQSEIPGTYDYYEIEMKADNVQSTANGYILSGTTIWVKNGVECNENKLFES